VNSKPNSNQTWNAAEELGILLDSLAYVQSYAPDFPAEDCTTLADESARITARFDIILGTVPASPRRDWLQLARPEIVAGLAAFASDVTRASRHLDDAAEIIRRAICGKRAKTTFVVAPDGVTYPASDA
jgi:hypothetical protein